ncbi:DUF1062 domain-containing protein [Phyllobacterium sp. YR531]|uniref:DUF1062 domain-containing protein n=1 Tax=Phyllobacterium sp. YR531 TaxID=1144343 RepID=UPI00026F5B17|nr:DUF1062 domain-containing protein [Phyllobacterium sp. YR531]EJN03830.1 hypothetical protein PMI41_01465 [Phyllobacterium sp. YR531]
MCKTLKVHWTLVTRNAPQPWIICNGCGGYRRFKSSDKLRLNANGKKLDAWLIYKCLNCDKTWNRTLFERRNVKNIEPATLQALQLNDPQWIRQHAFDVVALRQKAQRVEEFAELDIEKQVLSHAEDCSEVEIHLSVPVMTSMRLDRLLANELAMSRSRLQTLYEAERLRIDPVRKGALRRPCGEGFRIVFDLSCEEDRAAILRSACSTHGDHGI